MDLRIIIIYLCWLHGILSALVHLRSTVLVHASNDMFLVVLFVALAVSVSDVTVSEDNMVLKEEATWKTHHVLLDCITIQCIAFALEKC